MQQEWWSCGGNRLQEHFNARLYLCGLKTWPFNIKQWSLLQVRRVCCCCAAIKMLHLSIPFFFWSLLISHPKTSPVDRPPMIQGASCNPAQVDDSRTQVNIVYKKAVTELHMLVQKQYNWIWVLLGGDSWKLAPCRNVVGLPLYSGKCTAFVISDY